jgi:ABC-type iron transport system FetAB ATPase subunit
MIVDKKIHKIETLSRDKFIDLINALLGKMGYKNIHLEDEMITAELSSPMSSIKEAFILFDEGLTGNFDTHKLLEKIEKQSNTQGFASFHLVSKKNISKGFIESISLGSKKTINYLSRDKIIEHINRYLEDYWSHDDVQLIGYERFYKDSIVRDSDLKSLKIFSDKYQKLLDIFIEPKIIHFDEDPETKTPISRKISIEHIVSEKNSLIIAGEAGMGKSTLLKRIGEAVINLNSENSTMSLPVFITVNELHLFKYEISKILTDKLLPHFTEDNLETLFANYSFVLLLDSIDELEKEHQIYIIKQINILRSNHNIRFILATRNQEKSVTVSGLESIKTYDIGRFNNQQIEQFVKRFFLNQQHRAESLLESLRENRVIEKLPVTPLTLSLISILYEENDLEIPATITDIYDNFNSLLIGKPLVTSKIELIDVSFRERILSLYGLELLQRKEHNPMEVSEFKNHFRNYYASKTIPLRTGTLDEFLTYMIDNAGILHLKNDKYVAFSHDSFMEYYASLEIFKHQRELQELYVQNFFDINWQNSAIFYAGHSKDMNSFLEKINSKLTEAKDLNEYFAAISGAGFILQALFQTDNRTRKITIENALEVNVKTLELLLKLAGDDKFVFKSFRLPIIWMLTVLNFYDNFNSGTLKEPLKLCFEELKNQFVLNANETIGFKSLILGFTLNSKRINENIALEELVFSSPLLSNNILTIIAEIGLQFLSEGSSKELKNEVKKQFKKAQPVLKGIIEKSTDKMRFSNFDVFHSEKKVKLVTEGKTDALIIEHAYMVLRNGEVPYWAIKSAGNESGSAHEVNKSLMSAKSTVHNDEIVIGVFDHDSKGISEFKRLDSKLFTSIKNNTVKKHKDANIYAILLPIPGDKSHYLLPEQEFNYFELEHYLPFEFLKELDAIKETQLSASKDIYCIKDGKKNTLMKKVVESVDKKMFEDFILLFNEIDQITGNHNLYD